MFFEFESLERYDECDIETLLLQEFDNIKKPRTPDAASKHIELVQPTGPELAEPEPEIVGRLDWDYKDTYNAYSQVEKHIGFAESLYFLNKRGHYLLDEIRRTKFVTPDSPRPGSGGEASTSEQLDVLVDSVTYAIVSTVRARMMGTSTLMNELYCYLEEVMFQDVGDSDIEEFFILDDSYPLTAMYYSQETWVVDHGIQQFSFARDRKFEEGELMMIVCFFNDYISLLDKIAEYLDGGKTEVHRRLEYTVGRISGIIERVKGHVLDQISRAFDEADC